MPKHLKRLSDLSREDIEKILVAAGAFKEHPDLAYDKLAGRSVTMYFSKPSTRTRISFETAIHRLGGHPILCRPDDLQLGRGETIEDTARVLSRMSAAFVIRTFADDDVERFARAATIPVINALTDGHHPCQALADLLTWRERFGSFDGLTVTYVGAGNNVAHSLLEACAIMGIHARVAAPPELPPDGAVVERARQLAGGRSEVTITTDASAAARGADCVYADTWLSMGDPPEEREKRLEILAPYRVTRDLMASASARAVFMHCLPAHRGEEVEAEVMDGDRSIVFDQAENRLHTSMAILDLLCAQ